MSGSVELTRALAEHTAALALDRLPAEVIAKAKLCVLDTLGCAIAGVAHPVVVSLVDALRPALVDDGTGASLWGRGIRTTALQAVLVNSSVSSVVNADDAHK